MAASIPVVMASDQSSVPVTLLGQPISSITKPTNAGGLMSVSASVGAVATEAKAGPGQMYGMTLGNSNATPVYVQMFDALAANVILGTTAPKYSFLVPAGGTLARDFSNGVEFSNAITFACTSTRTGNVAAANSVDVNFDIC
jgi:hypothetical protein